MNLAYTIDLDHRVWIPVPMTYPWNGYADSAAWSRDLAASLLGEAGAPAEVVDAFRDAAGMMSSVAPPLPGALERFWHFPAAGAADRLVHLYVSDTEASTAEDLAQLAVAGVGGIVQTVTVFEDTAFDVAISAVALARIGESEIAVLRVLGLSEGYVFVVELLEPDPVVLEQLQPEVEALFRSIRLRRDEAQA
jgi:hypothetical protein